tara:strand:+ start:2003 stop:2344 length:342 start_codon:yes stop_codon:yes gene_type:complete
MALQYSNITGSSAQVLVAKRKVRNASTGAIDVTFSSQDIKTISLCNIHATDDVIVALYIYDSTLGTYYILKNVTIPNGSTLVLDSKDFSYWNGDYELKIKLNAAGSAVDVMIK